MTKDISTEIQALLSELSEEEREQTLKILSEFAEKGNSDLFKEMMYEDFEEIPVDIETFIEDDRYLGKAFKGPNGDSSIFPFWKERLKEIFDPKNEVKELILTGSIGIGKSQPLDSKVLTQDGFCNMGDITLESKVFGADGKLHNVIGIFPQGKRPVYKVTFSDNTNVFCDKEHLWNVADRFIEGKGRYEYHTKSLSDIMSQPIKKLQPALNNCNCYRWYIPMCNPIQFNRKELVIPPYIMGCLIGDGTLSKSSFDISVYDEELYNKLQNIMSEYGYELRYNSSKHPELKDYIVCVKGHTIKDSNVVNTWKRYCKSIFGMNCVAHTKFIPKDYLYSSVEDRLELLRGLMDTDGTTDTNGFVSFGSVSEQLCDDVIWLVQSLGGTATKHIRNKYRGKETPTYMYKYKGKVEERPCRVSYEVFVRMPKSMPPFSLSRKLNRLNPRRLEPFRQIRDIQYVGEQDCQCILLDSDEHLYITDNFIVTHNTRIAVIAFLYELYQVLCCKNPKAYLGVAENETIYFGLFNVTLDLVRDVVYMVVKSVIRQSPWFNDHGAWSGNKDSSEWKPYKDVRITIGSNEAHSLGKAIFCVKGNTLVKVDSGYKNIEDITVDDKIICIDNRGRFVKCSKQPIQTAIVDNLIKITLVDGTVIECTPEHKIILENGELIEAKDLIPGMNVLGVDK